MHMHGMDAMDFFRGIAGVRHRGGGERSWRQFLNYVDRLSATEGSAVWAAKLTDPEMLEELWAEYRKDRTIFDTVEAPRPSLVGFTREVQGLTNIANVAIGARIDAHPSLARALDHMPIPMFTKEILEERFSKLAKEKRLSAIEEAQQRWQDEFDRTGVAPN